MTCGVLLYSSSLLHGLAEKLQSAQAARGLTASLANCRAPAGAPAAQDDLHVHLLAAGVLLPLPGSSCHASMRLPAPAPLQETLFRGAACDSPL